MNRNLVPIHQHRVQCIVVRSLEPRLTLSPDQCGADVSRATRLVLQATYTPSPSSTAQAVLALMARLTRRHAHAQVRAAAGPVAALRKALLTQVDSD